MKILISFFNFYFFKSDVMASDFIDVSNSDTNVKCYLAQEAEPKIKDNDTEIQIIEKEKYKHLILPLVI